MCSVRDKERNIQSAEVCMDVRLSPVVYEWCTGCSDSLSDWFSDVQSCGTDKVQGLGGVQAPVVL